MKKIFLILLVFPFYVFSQVNENFSDGNFTSNPVWTGETTEFIVNTAFQLQLTATVPYTAPSDTAYLSTANSRVADTEWRFWVKLSFATSANNHSRVYLVSDQSNLEGPLNGYFVQLGDFGDSKDSISLYKQSGTTYTKIIRGTIVYTNNSSNTFRVKVTCDNSGNWKLYSDVSGGTNFVEEGSCYDNTFTTSGFLGVFCKYTSSNNNKFYFDDFYAGPIIIDNTPPTVNSVSVIAANQVDVLFSEAVEPVTAQNTGNYSANNGLGNPILALRDAVNSSLIHLTFQQNFPNGQLNNLTISNVKDIAGNTMITESKDFVYYVVKAFDIVLNELMVDPDPVVGLPPYEYIEIFNKTSFPLSLRGFKLVFGTYTKTFPDTAAIGANSYLLITKDDAVSQFLQYGPVIGLFSNIYSLTNDGSSVILMSPAGNVISSVNYTLDWYKDSNKDDGGWSLEQIDPLNPCGEIANWHASTDGNGGTPGKQNSVNAGNPDLIHPEVSRIGVKNDSMIQVYFTEPLDSSRLKKLTNYSIDNSIGNPVSVSLIGPDYKALILGLKNKIQPSVIYTLTITDTITDCIGNAVNLNSTKRFALPEEVFANDIVINEVLFDPKDDGVDFVELYNRSVKVFDLKNVYLTSMDTITNTLTDIMTISDDGYLLFPEDYIVLTTSKSKVTSQYNTTNPNGFAEMTSFPSYNNEGGVVVITKKNYDIIDKFAYNPSMQLPILNSSEGVSLERIDYDRPADDATNWHSASEAAGFATPAYKNSQFSKGEAIDDPITIEPEVFSPDNDGYNDIVNISYKFSEAGYVANISIFDAKGRLIKKVIKNELLGTTGTFSWDGINESNEKANIGIYIIYFEVFDIKGIVKHYKKTCVLASKL
jgi:hypothetical protein